MWFVLPALGAAAAYASDVILGKKALDTMPLHTFAFLICVVYFFVGLAMAAVWWREFAAFFSDRANRPAIRTAVGAILVGTVVADLLAWTAVKMAHVTQGAMVSILLTTAPLFAVIVLFAVYRQKQTLMVGVGMAMVMGGGGVLLWELGKGGGSL